VVLNLRSDSCWFCRFGAMTRSKSKVARNDPWLAICRELSGVMHTNLTDYLDSAARLTSKYVLKVPSITIKIVLTLSLHTEANPMAKKIESTEKEIIWPRYPGSSAKQLCVTKT
jgi:hypothetical protein